MDEGYKIDKVSSLNLRSSRGKEDRSMEEPIEFFCSGCERYVEIGKDTSVYVQVDYGLKGHSFSLELCETCIDLFTDMARKGTAPLENIDSWKIESRNVRVKRTVESLHCPKCKKVHDTHMYIKFDNLNSNGDKCSYGSFKRCAQCCATYLEGLRTAEINGDIKRVEFMEEEDAVYV